MNILFILVILLILSIVLVIINRRTISQISDVWHSNIEKDVLKNENWREVQATGTNLQVVNMSVPIGEELGLEVHPDNDQFFRVEQGKATLHVEDGSGERNISLTDGDAALVPSGIMHNVINTGNTPLKMYTVYGPPHHPKDRVDRTHADEILRENK
jgi:mannose-6-phosphate isomerase-like protein (cupin superfamily)